MSEFKKLVAGLQRVSDAVETYGKKASTEKEAITWQSEFETIYSLYSVDLTELALKLEARKSQIDPITKEPRFGPKMLAKVTEALLQFESLKESVEATSEIRNKEAAFAQQEMEVLEAESQRLKDQQEKELSTQREQALEQQARDAEQAEKEENEKREALAEKAQQVRTEKERLREEVEIEAARLEAEQTALNAGISNDVKGITAALALLRQNTDDREYRGAVQTLQIFIKNICDQPENEKFRQIKANNAHYHQDIGRFVGGHQCLHAMGFLKRLIEEEDVFLLEEPNLEDDFDKWSDWFENLKMIRDYLLSDAK